MLIQIQELGERNGIFQAKVNFGGLFEYNTTIVNPFSQNEEDLLEWYFERHLAFPFTDKVQAQEAGSSIVRYGESLFAQTFQANAQALSFYTTTTHAQLKAVQIEIIGEPSFHALHWETLKDPGSPEPVTLQAAMVRKSPTQKVHSIPARLSSVINLLIVKRNGPDADRGNFAQKEGGFAQVRCKISSIARGGGVMLVHQLRRRRRIVSGEIMEFSTLVPSRPGPGRP